ncbi:hypothetical protein FXO38_34294 [Capsicum annuum]|nr:hypothetical protein FXO38_34294 [Capsicum annuum]KAF3666691.1 hypothetical protein FXO37_10402 [Capsicum annuum]
MPKYSKHCKLQGHRESECFILHPELRETYADDELEGEQEQDGTRTLTSGKVVGPPNKDLQGMELEEETRAYNRRRDNYHRNQPKQKWNVIKDKRIFTPNRGTSVDRNNQRPEYQKETSTEKTLEVLASNSSSEFKQCDSSPRGTLQEGVATDERQLVNTGGIGTNILSPISGQYNTEKMSTPIKDTLSPAKKNEKNKNNISKGTKGLNNKHCEEEVSPGEDGHDNKYYRDNATEKNKIVSEPSGEGSDNSCHTNSNKIITCSGENNDPISSKCEAHRKNVKENQNLVEVAITELKNCSNLQVIPQLSIH